MSGSTRLLGRLLLTLFALAVAMGGGVAAEPYPVRPVRLIVPFPPGGGNDVFARVIGAHLGESLGQQVIVDNRAGASGTIGTSLAAKAAPDGYTLVLSYTGTLAINPHLFKDLPYDPVKDFAPVTLIASAPLVLVVHPTLPVHSVAELIALARAKPGTLNFASSGNGTGGHLAGELFKSTANLDIIHIPYKGTGPAMTDMLAGHVQMYFAIFPAALPHVQAGALRALAVTSSKRSGMMPDTPTVAEAGLPGFEMVLRYGIAAPAGTPADIVARLNRETRAVLGKDDVKQRLAAEGAEPEGSTPEEYAAVIKSELVKWGDVVRKSGAHLD